MRLAKEARMLRKPPLGSARRGLAPSIWPPLLLLAVLVVVWKLALTRGWVSPLILPPPEDIVRSFVKLITGGLITTDIVATVWESVAGFVLGAAIGLALAIPSGLSPTIRKMLAPYAVSLQVTPRIAIAPLIVTWAGFGYGSKIWIAAIIAFFPVYVNTLTGMLTVDEDSREMFRSLGATQGQTFFQLMVPSSLPLVFAGLKTAAGMSLIGAVVGEFISAARGLGVLIQLFASQLLIADVFAVILLLMIVGFLLYGTVEWLEWTTVFWLHDSRLLARTRRRSARSRRHQASTKTAIDVASDVSRETPTVGSGSSKN